jgi:3-deoxy-D-manno-oct-2-ulosonic acid (Kdo) hydroxylase
VAALERGMVIVLPNLRFIVTAEEQSIFSPAILSSSKNTSFDPASGRLSGTALAGADLDRLRGVIARFSEHAAALVDNLLPRYRGRVSRARTSFRPAEVAGRQQTWRKDDTRLHVDSFPASPVQGRRILRVFSNVNPDGRPRSWRVGGDFETTAARFAGSLSLPRLGSAALLELLRVTKSRRTAYDALMLQLHDRMKEDAEFQKRSEQEAVDLPAGSTWLAFTDQVSHAATAGQFQFEQTFILPVDAMMEQARSPLRILERLKGRRLA